MAEQATEAYAASAQAQQLSDHVLAALHGQHNLMAFMALSIALGRFMGSAVKAQPGSLETMLLDSGNLALGVAQQTTDSQPLAPVAVPPHPVLAQRVAELANEVAASGPLGTQAAVAALTSVLANLVVGLTQQAELEHTGGPLSTVQQLLLRQVSEYAAAEGLKYCMPGSDMVLVQQGTLQ